MPSEHDAEVEWGIDGDGEGQDSLDVELEVNNPYGLSTLGSSPGSKISSFASRPII